MVTITMSAAGAKNAATRLRDFLAIDGINLKQTHAYEALAQVLGYANWNTLQALLNATPSSGIADKAAKGSAGKPVVHADEDAKGTIWIYTAERMAEQAAPRTAIPLDPKEFDKFIGCYQFRRDEYMTVTRDGDRFFARLTEQAPVEFYPESETKFFTRKVHAQLSFNLDAQNRAVSVVLHQDGNEVRAKRVDDSVGKNFEDALQKYVANGKATPEREILLRRLIAASQSGTPNFEDMSPGLVEVSKRRWPGIHRTLVGLGKLTDLKFLRVEPYGLDVYNAVFENGQLTYKVGSLTPDHKLDLVRYDE